MPAVTRDNLMAARPETIYSQWQQRSDAENFELNREFLARYCQPLPFSADTSTQNKTWVFSHVPKTAGTTLENVLGKNVPLKDLLRINAPVLNAHPGCYGANGRHPQLVMGHHPLHGLLYQLLRDAPLYHFCLVRHPLKRVISWYNYILDRPEHALHTRVQKLDFDEFLEQPDLVELHNGQCRRFTGRLHADHSVSDRQLFEEALAVVNDCFSFVGTTERFIESLLLLQKALGLKDIYHQRHNRSRSVIDEAGLTAGQRQKITALNRADMALYDRIDDKLSTLTAKHLDAGAASNFARKNRQWQALLF
jgi:hypothetical protein